MKMTVGHRLVAKRLGIRRGRWSHQSLFDFEVGPSELLQICGNNGSGKSTLLGVIAGVLTPESGSVGLKPEAKPSFSYLAAESNGLYLDLSAERNLNFWAKLQGASNEEVDAIWNRLGFKGHPIVEALPLHHYSTGMRRRVGLARLALSKAPCWLIDEPLLGLDAAGVGFFTELLGDHLKRGGCGVLVTHEARGLDTLITNRLQLGHNV